jgi:hypothetical protein
MKLIISFPQCFGPNENEPLDPNASETAFSTLREQIIEETGRDLSMDEMVCLHQLIRLTRRSTDSSKLPTRPWLGLSGL